MAIHHVIFQKSKECINAFQSYIDSQKEIRKQNFQNPFLEDKNNISSENIQMDISLSSALKIIFTLTLLFLLWKFINQTSHILISLFFAGFLSATLYPSVRFFEKRNIPRPIAIALVFISLISFIIFLFSTIIPALVSQAISLGEWFIIHTKQLYVGDFSGLPFFLQTFGPSLQESLLRFDEYFQSLQTSSETQKGFLQIITDNIDKISSWKDGITSLITEVMKLLGNMLLVLLMVFFIILDRESIRTFLLSFFPFSLQKYLYIKSYQVQEKLSEWVHGQMILFIFMGTTTWFFLSIIGVDYALAIGFISGLGEFLPFVGPPLTLLVALPLAFGEGIDIGFYTIIFFACLQFIEGNILVPMVMEKAVGITPIVTLLSMLVGFQFLGILGAIMAIPMAAILGLFLDDLRSKNTFTLKENAEKTDNTLS